jgi:hypothetical protein
MSVNAVIEGVGKIQASLEKLEKEAKQEMLKTLNRVAGEIFAQSQRVVPVDTGNLRASGRVIAAKETNLTATLTYGGSAVTYAMAVHEKRIKYLEEPFRRNERRFKEQMAAAAKRIGQ